MTLFLYPVDQAVARSTGRVPRTSKPALFVATLELILLVVIVVVAAAITIFGINFTVLTTSILGSTMPAGSLIVSHNVDAGSAAAGDIVTISPVSPVSTISPVGAHGQLTGELTGRVLEVQSAQSGLSSLTLAVDEAGSLTAVYEVATAQQVLLTLPEAGYFVVSAAQPVAIGFVLLVALGFVLQLTPSHRRRGRASQRARAHHAPHAA
jgi:hypothetical protein